MWNIVITHDTNTRNKCSDGIAHKDARYAQLEEGCCKEEEDVVHHESEFSRLEMVGELCQWDDMHNEMSWYDAPAAAGNGKLALEKYIDEQMGRQTNTQQYLVSQSLSQIVS